jgi:transposase InsO family protein
VLAGVELRTDHGPQYTGADCAALIEACGLVHTLAPAGRPTGNAAAERVIARSRKRSSASGRAARRAQAWQHRYNTARPHQVLGWMTPAEYRAEKLGLAVGRLHSVADERRPWGAGLAANPPQVERHVIF